MFHNRLNIDTFNYTKYNTFCSPNSHWAVGNRKQRLNVGIVYVLYKDKTACNKLVSQLCAQSMYVWFSSIRFYTIVYWIRYFQEQLLLNNISHNYFSKKHMKQHFNSNPILNSQTSFASFRFYKLPLCSNVKTFTSITSHRISMSSFVYHLLNSCNQTAKSENTAKIYVYTLQQMKWIVRSWLN